MRRSCWRNLARGQQKPLILLLVASCGGSQGSDSIRASVSDSAGITRIDFERLPTGPGAVRIAPEPDLELGGLRRGDSVEFDARSIYLNAAQLADGQIVVGDHTQLKYFDAVGRLIRVVGRKGFGPGEFSNIRLVCPQLDSSVLVVDDDRRWSRWDSMGRLVATFDGPGLVTNDGCSTAGHLLVRSNISDRAGAGHEGHVRQYDLFAADGRKHRALGEAAGARYYGPIFFEPRFAVSERDWLIANPRRYEWYTQSFDTPPRQSRWTVHEALREVTDREWDSLAFGRAPDGSSPEMRRRVIASINAIGKPPHFPAYDRLRRDPEGRVWFSANKVPGRWYVVDSGGRRLSMLDIPLRQDARPHLVNFVEGRVVIRHLDEQGSPRLSFFRVLSR